MKSGSLLLAAIRMPLRRTELRTLRVSLFRRAYNVPELPPGSAFTNGSASAPASAPCNTVRRDNVRGLPSGTGAH